MRLRPALWALVAVALLVLGVVTVSFAEQPDTAHITASSSGTSTPLDELLEPSTDPARTPVWESSGETVGSWLETTWSRPTEIDRVRVRGSAGRTASSALLTFDGGASLAIALDSEGDADVTFPRRSVSSARLTIAEVDADATSVALSGLVIDDSGSGAIGLDVSGAVAGASSGVSAALVDGGADSDTGQEWAVAGTSGWVELSWPDPRLVSAVQVFGPGEALDDPEHRFAPALRGELVFGDGSRVVVSGIAGGAGAPTTVAFTPRVVDRIRLLVTTAQPEAVLGLRELRAVAAGSTPTRWPAEGTILPDALPAGAATCDQVPPTPVDGTDLRLACPTAGSTVGRPFSIAVDANAGTSVTARSWEWDSGSDSGAEAVVARGTADDAGRVVLAVDPRTLSTGPLAVAVSADDAPAGAAPLVVQLYNAGGRSLPRPDHAPDGMTLQWDEDFRDPVSVSLEGSGTTYGAAKPAYWGPADFGDAAFADPGRGGESLAVLGGEFLRLRASPAAEAGETTSYGQQYVSGLLSSLGVGATGFSAQYGYFEARITGGPGIGSWPAFWMLNTQSATTDDDTSGEVDAVELYGHNPLGSCHTLHDWGRPGAEPETADPACVPVNGFSDWTTTWHTYGARITPDGATFYIDGVEVARERGLARSSEPFFFLVNLALGGGWPVDLTPSQGRSDLYVDWIRVYT